jgi:hypothetical protein
MKKRCDLKMLCSRSSQGKIMKKLFTYLGLAGVLFISAEEMNGQNDTRFGIKGGWSSFGGTLDVLGVEMTTESNDGFAAGIFADIPIHYFLSVQPELLYIQKNTGDTNGLLNGTDIVESAFMYIDLPLLLKFNFPISQHVSPFFTAGPYAGYLLKAEDTINGVTLDVSEFMKDFNYGLIFGAGTKLSHFELEVRYDVGLANIIDSESFFGTDSFEYQDNSLPGEVSGKLRGVMITLGISF